MAITGKVVTMDRLTHFKEKTDELYATQDALGQKADSSQVTQLQGELEKKANTSDLEGYLKLDSIDTSLEGYVKDDELTEQLSPYAKTEDISKSYATKEEIGALGTIQGSCKKTELDSKKEGASVNDVWVVTDDDNHMYYYNGTDFVDTQAVAHVDLSNYVEKEQGKSLVSDTDVTQITTNKNDIASLRTDKADKSELESYIKSDSITEATDEDIDALFA